MQQTWHEEQDEEREGSSSQAAQPFEVTLASLHYPETLVQG